MDPAGPAVPPLPAPAGAPRSGPSAPSPRPSVDVLSSLRAFAELAPAWNELVAEAGLPAVARYEVLAAWLRYRLRPGEGLHVVVFRHAGEIVGICPLLLAPRRLGRMTFPAAAPVGRNAFVPGPGLAARRGWEETVARAFAAHVTRPGFPARFLRLAGVHPGGPLEVALARAARTAGGYLRHEAVIGSAELELPPPGTPVDAGWRPARRRGVRRARGLLAGEGRVEAGLVPPEHLARALEEAFAVAERSWQGRRGTAISSSPESRAFYRDLAARLGPPGKFQLWLLAVDGRAVAFEVCLREGDTLCELKRGFDPAWRATGIGLALAATMIEEFRETGGRRVLFFQPATADKLAWGAAVREYRQLAIFPRGSLARLVHLADRLRRSRLNPLVRAAFAQRPGAPPS